MKSPSVIHNSQSGHGEAGGRDPAPRLSLADSADLLATLIENSPNLVWACHFDGRRGFANRDCCGYSVEEWERGGLEFCRSLHTPDSLRRFDLALEYARAAGERVTNVRLELSEKRGGTRIFLGHLAPLRRGDGAVSGVQGILHDITELESAQRALRDSETRFHDIVETAHDLVWSTNSGGRWTYLNPASRRIYGLEPDDMLGRALEEFAHPDHREHDRQAFQQALAGREIVQHETVHLRADGQARHLSFNIKPRLDREWNIVGAMGTARDITEQKFYQQQLQHLAEHDALTGLYNRQHFERELDRAVARAAAGEAVYGLLYVDLDNFKYVNDTLGHAAGDALLVELGQRLQERLRQGDVLARFGSDEFTLLLRDMSKPKLQQVIQSFHRLFRGYTFFQQERAFDIRVSIGAVLMDARSPGASEVLAQADLACATAKARGRNQAHVYDTSDTAKADMVSDVNWSRQINEALARDRFALLFQPIVRISDGAVDHYEVLLRLRGPDDSLIVPGAFLPAAERFGLVHAIDRWVVEHAIAQLAERHRAGQRHSFSINLSGRAFEDPELLPAIGRALEASELDPSALTFEITETAAISHMAVAKGFIEHLKALNCRFALDDFGSGFSSYGYLKFLPADYLKIDGGFVQNLARDPVDQAIVQSMNQVAHALGKQTIAEFVEDEKSLQLLKSYGVDYAQGYYLGRPGPQIGGPP
jgi:diguanylate cyclase (GGDEF)-like protein/PAS domain S-box-containing protein